LCDDHDPADLGWDDESDAQHGGLSRRSFLTGAVGAATIGFTGVRNLWLPSRAAAATNAAGETAYRHAMHIHSSFSEGAASLEAQVREAIASGCHVLHTTDHDWRMSAYDAPDVFHFATSPETVSHRRYSWKAGSKGTLAAKGGGIVASPVSPYDPASTKGSLRVEATSGGSALATHRFALDGGGSNNCHRTNITGQTLKVDVLADAVGSNGWAEVLVTLSYRPPLGGRKGGKYTISYRIGTAAYGRSVTGTAGVVTLPVPVGKWTTVSLTPEADAAALWPDVVAGDNALGALALGAGSNRRFATRVFFGHLRFARARSSGQQPLEAQRELIAAYAERYPALQVWPGVEISGKSSDHANGFFTPQLTDYRQGFPADGYRFAADLMHAAGGLASLNHPFGTGTGALQSSTGQDDLRRKVAAKLLARDFGGVDILETGYRQRSGAGLETHLDLAATAWRNGFWLTANGVSDNHFGALGSWLKEPNRFVTGVWQSEPTSEAAYQSLRRGACFVGELGSFAGSLDVSVDDVGMGMVSVRPELTTRLLAVSGSDLPTGSVIEVVRGPVDYSGAVDPATAVVHTLAAADLQAGAAVVPIDTSSSCFVYVVVATSGGRRVAFSNPVFLLHEEPPAARAVPQWRRALDSAAL